MGFAAESLPVELWVANDIDEVLEGCMLHYEVRREGRTIAFGSVPAKVERCIPSVQGVLEVNLPIAGVRPNITLAAALVDSSGTPLYDTELTLEVFPNITSQNAQVFVFGDELAAISMLDALGLQRAASPIEKAEIVLITNAAAYLAAPEKVDRAVRHGATAILLSLPVGNHRVGDSTIQVRAAGMGPRHFVSCDSGHPLVEGFQSQDFKFWHDENLGHATPLLTTVLEGETWSPILQSGDGGWGRAWESVPVAVERSEQAGCWRICQMEIMNRLETNPCAALFARRLLGKQTVSASEIAPVALQISE